jgi:hypothetical protein
MVVDTPREPAGLPPPRWVSPSLEVKRGQDPLGLQTTTIDQLMPRLLPGILELSQRARYFSFYAYLLDLYRERHGAAVPAALSDFIKAREWEYGLAVLHCPHDCGSVPVGAVKLRAVTGHQDPPYPRGFSVQSDFGGFGLYYRSPLSDMAIVARSGTPLGDTPIPIDVLYPTPRARHLADTFRDAVDGTAYVKTWMFRSDPIPLDVLVEYASVACLCQLKERDDERDAVYDAFFGTDDDLLSESDEQLESVVADIDSTMPESEDVRHRTARVRQRRASVAHYLTLVQANPDIVDDSSAYREAFWAPPSSRSALHELVAGEWAGLVAKDIWQDALCSIWSEFCRSGLAANRAGGDDGLSWSQTQDLARAMVNGPPSLDPDQRSVDLVTRIVTGDVTLPDITPDLPSMPMESLRVATAHLDTATSGLVVLLELHRRVCTRADSGWVRATTLRSPWQPSLASVLQAISSHLETNATVADTLWWIVDNFILTVHERIAYSKLPEHTFRFRWENGRVRFYNNGIGRFPLASIRQDPLASLTNDIGFWDRDPKGRPARLTPRGSAFIDEVLS